MPKAFGLPQVLPWAAYKSQPQLSIVMGAYFSDVCYLVGYK